MQDFFMTRVGLTYNKNHALHDYMLKGFPSPENKRRLDSIIDYLKKNDDILDGNKCQLFSDASASVEDIYRVHTKEYVDFVKEYADKGGGFLGKDTYVCKESYEVLLQAVGCVLKAGDLVTEDGFDHSFALIRPPGHHAGVDTYGGFCLFNNAAILTRYLQYVKGMKNIAIINIDAHASNGTQSIFYSDPSVLCISIHQDPSTIYPHDGFMNQIGTRPALGYNINMEMPPECGNKEYDIFFENIAQKILEQFSPDLIIIECGFDAYYKESLTAMNLTPEGYYNIISRISNRWKTVVLLEGGYNEDLGLLSSVVLEGLLGEHKFNDNIDKISLLLSRRTKSREQFEEKVKIIKNTLNGYWNLQNTH